MRAVSYTHLIDAKFPIDAYNGLLDAYDTADAAQVEAAAKVLEQRIRQFAKDIHCLLYTSRCV